jgi:hypothetical protein
MIPWFLGLTLGAPVAGTVGSKCIIDGTVTNVNEPLANQYLPEREKITLLNWSDVPSYQASNKGKLAKLRNMHQFRCSFSSLLTRKPIANQHERSTRDFESYRCGGCPSALLQRDHPLFHSEVTCCARSSPSFLSSFADFFIFWRHAAVSHFGGFRLFYEGQHPRSGRLLVH